MSHNGDPRIDAIANAMRADDDQRGMMNATQRWEDRARVAVETADNFTCPRCGAVSWNPHDLEQGYCGRCHWWTADPILGHVELPSSQPDTPEL